MNQNLNKTIRLIKKRKKIIMSYNKQSKEQPYYEPTYQMALSRLKLIYQIKGCKNELKEQQDNLARKITKFNDVKNKKIKLNDNEAKCYQSIIKKCKEEEKLFTKIYESVSNLTDYWDINMLSSSDNPLPKELKQALDEKVKDFLYKLPENIGKQKSEQKEIITNFNQQIKSTDIKEKLINWWKKNDPKQVNYYHRRIKASLKAIQKYLLPLFEFNQSIVNKFIPNNTRLNIQEIIDKIKKVRSDIQDKRLANQRKLQFHKICINKSKYNNFLQKTERALKQLQVKIKKLKQEINRLKTRLIVFDKQFFNPKIKLPKNNLLPRHKLWMLGIDFQDVIKSKSNKYEFAKNKNEPGYIDAIETAIIFSLIIGTKYKKEKITVDLINKLRHLATCMVEAEFIEGIAKISDLQLGYFAGGSLLLYKKDATLEGIKKMKDYKDFLVIKASRRQSNIMLDNKEQKSILDKFLQFEDLTDKEANYIHHSIGKNIQQGMCYQISSKYFYVKDDGTWDNCNFSDAKNYWYEQDLQNLINGYYSNMQNSSTNNDKILAMANFIRGVALCHPFNQGNLRTIRLLTNLLLTQNDLPHTLLNDWHHIHGHSPKQIAKKIVLGTNNYKKLFYQPQPVQPKTAKKDKNLKKRKLPKNSPQPNTKKQKPNL
ncbi:MAG: Fic family protein [Gammaproteobacteria bacterium]